MRKPRLGQAGLSTGGNAMSRLATARETNASFYGSFRKWRTQFDQSLMLGARRVIAIDKVPERLAMAEAGGAETIDFSKPTYTTS
jgi:hypothetical protein